MTDEEKLSFLKNTVYQLYVKENRSKSYISRLLGVSRKSVSEMITEWNFPEPEPVRHLSPANQKFINKNRNLIIARFAKNIPLTQIADELKVSRYYLLNCIEKDDACKQAKNAYTNRIKQNAEKRNAEQKKKSYYEYDATDLKGEQWKEVLGYPGYQVSNCGRVRHYAKRYSSYHLLTPYPNINNGRLYVALSGSKTRNLQIARLVAFAFVDGHDEEHNTVNHKDGDVANNYANNLKWISQSENNLHAYQELGRDSTYGNQHINRYSGKYFLYQGKYQFKTVKALAKFIGKSETQVRRYLESDPSKHSIEIKNSNKEM